MKNILIYGASGHSKMIVDIILKNKNYTIKGLVDSYKPIDEDIYGYKVIGNLVTLPKLIKEHNIHGIVIGIGDNSTRKKAYDNIANIAPDLEFVSIVHPSVILAHDITIPKGTVIMAGVVINANAKVGEFCILNTKSSLGHDSNMSDFSSLASGTIIGGNVQIGYCSAICLSASITQNISIGKHTVIGAGSLVLKSIGDCKQAFGIPINTIKDREPDSKYLG
ncbi:NeuD/PglB/VioB family sugar acetyltransferase [uncultured Algibacter sp.]|uniref:NeuD/PglB/VioB family sugar acetyltransferase n=1 Tax=uncultured Algibacter sp. TaxID=298659 RepID=UPI0030ED25DA|tara:strand:- start:100 stop:765 length:666 start_codon:yes stop_codon:yes gene_type:complete